MDSKHKLHARCTRDTKGLSHAGGHDKLSPVFVLVSTPRVTESSKRCHQKEKAKRMKHGGFVFYSVRLDLYNS